MTKYFPTVGLEIHAELATNTKMFCGCKNDPDEEKPNVNICPVCMAHPGALPVINKKAVENVIKVGLAINGNIADFTEFDRKNYFYPDIPKGYQISQYKFPIVSGGHLADMDVTRIHLEEDTGTNKHSSARQPARPAGGDLAEGYSLVDFNRAGVPLMELVTEPHTFESVEEAAKKATRFAKEFQLILWYLDVSEANMEKGEMRVEANISITKDPKVFGTKVEVKNLNSFRNVERAIKYEIDRMTKLMDAGKEEEIVQETRGWNDAKQETFSQRKKEASHDYRYFPDPDLPKMMLHEVFDLEQMKKDLPELPVAKRERYKKEFEIKDEDIESYINEPKLANLLEETIKLTNSEETKDFSLDVRKERYIQISNTITSDVVGNLRVNPDLDLPTAKSMADLMQLYFIGAINSRTTKDTLLKMMETGVSPKTYIEENNLMQKDDVVELRQIAQKIIGANPKVVA